MPSPDAPGKNRSWLRLIDEAVKRRTYLFKIPDVLGTAVGYRITGGERTHEPAVIIYVRPGRKAKDPKKLPRHQRIPHRLRLSLGGETVWLPVDLVELDTGRLCATSFVAGSTVANVRNVDNFGTVGWIARDGDGQPVLCGSYHVFLRPPDAYSPPSATQRFRSASAPRESLMCPCSIEGGDPVRDVVGFVKEGVRSRFVDAAVATVDEPDRVDDLARFIGRLEEIRDLNVEEIQPGGGETVRAVVRRSAPLTGKLLETSASFPFVYPDFPDGLRMLDLIATDIPTQAGDSGALLVDGARRALGMLIGRDESGARSFFMHIQHVVDALQLRPFR